MSSVFQTRNPTAWDTYLYLYSPEGYYVAADYDSGDDGHGLSKITYLTPSEGWYRLTVWGYYYYGQYGPYALESVPATSPSGISSTPRAVLTRGRRRPPPCPHVSRPSASVFWPGRPRATTTEPS
ncbi:MAG: hypothetical protein HYU36_10620 [Planctomycetes bacterium]|nr:hypothetical protein [Planctomycetota bacterium]